ncbi:MAG: TetR/AcrR family transcriptional regulator [Aestuariivirgaceae bacterium]|nr:TetR/AcrR family transcriptional regulator [Aestuariivirgaceae bacterium]
MTSRPYHHGDLKAALVAAGIDILEAHGIPGLSLRAIAARCGVSHSAPKNHFGSLRGLLTAIAAEGFRRHAAAMREGLGEDATPEARLAAAMQGYADFAQASPALFQLMFSKLDCDFEDAALKDAANASYAVLRGISTGLDWAMAGQPDSQTRTEMMLWSLVHGYASLNNAGLFDKLPPHPIGYILPASTYRRPG